MEPGPAARRDRLRRRIAEAGLDALLVIHPPNVRYLSGFTGSSCALLVEVDAGTLLVTDGRYEEQAVEAAGADRLITRGDGWLAERVGGLARLGVESAHVSWQRVRELRRLLPGVEVVPTDGYIEALRRRKDDAELELLRRACTVTAAAWEAMLGWLAPGMTEREVAGRLTGELVDHGADDRAFVPIVASGPNSARPHHRPTDRRLQAADVLKVDFGALIDGYHADMTRVAAFGDPGPELRRVHAAVRAAQEDGIAAVSAGTTAGAVDDACRRRLAAEDLADRFVHSTGHGVGLEIHEEPILRAGSGARLDDRMAVTVEPGAYLPGLGGIRIEDVVVVTSSGAVVLTPASRDLVVL
jgi:Xaa-Pro aminopeptidase